MSTRHYNPRVRSHQPRSMRGQQGTVLLLTLLALLLIGALGAAMLLLASGESGIVGMQRTSTQVFYAAAAGLEEARGRLSPLHPNAIPKLPGITLPDALLEVLYVTNPAGGEVVAPQTPGNPYYDNEYAGEFVVPITVATVQTVASVQPAGAPPIPYKWVRITVKTERSAWQDISADGVFNSITPIFYAGDRQNLTGSGKRVYRITSLAVLPNGTQRMVQQDVVGQSYTARFPGAITMVGTDQDCRFQTQTEVHGEDQAGVAGQGGPAFGFTETDEADRCRIAAQDVQNRAGTPLYTGTDGYNPTPTPSLYNVTEPPWNFDPRNPDLRTSQGLQQLMNTVRALADQTAPPTPRSYGQCDALVNNPLVTVVEGDFRARNFSGCGVLLVTGKAKWSGNVTWKGVILVIGQGYLDFSGGGTRNIAGAVLVARIYDDAGNLLPVPQGTFMNPSGGTNIVNYNSRYVSNALDRLISSYRVLAFRQVSQ